MIMRDEIVRTTCKRCNLTDTKYRLKSILIDHKNNNTPEKIRQTLTFAITK